MKTKKPLTAFSFVTSFIVLAGLMQNKAFAQKPIASFACNDSIFCDPAGHCVDFWSQSGNAPTSWQWFFPGGVPDSSSSETPSSICYYSPGTYSVTLIATNSFGSDTITAPTAIKYFAGPPPPTVTVSGDTVFCPQGFSAYQWYYNGSPIPGATAYYYVTTLAGNYNVYVTDSLGCSALGNGAAVGGCLLTLSLINVSPASCGTCADGSATVYPAHGTWPVVVTWNTSPTQTGDSVHNLLPGTYSVCATDADGCTACVNPVIIDTVGCNAFSISITSTNSSCTSCSNGTATVNVSGGHAPYTYSWDMFAAQTTQTATGLTDMKYKVCVTEATLCTVCDSVTIGIGSCKADFALFPDTAPHTYYLVNYASGTGSLFYIWSWGDSTIDVGPYPTHTYADSGYYNICLHIQDAVGCTADTCSNYYLLRPGGNTMISVKVVPAVTSGIHELRNQKQLTVAPNPARDEFTIYGLPPNQGERKLTIYDIVGNEVYSTRFTGNEKTVSSKYFPAGIYFIRVNGNAEAIRLIKIE